MGLMTITIYNVLTMAHLTLPEVCFPVSRALTLASLNFQSPLCLISTQNRNGISLSILSRVNKELLSPPEQGNWPLLLAPLQDF